MGPFERGLISERGASVNSSRILPSKKEIEKCFQDFVR